MIIASKDFRDEELFETKEEIEKEKILVEVVSSKIGFLRGAKGTGFECKNTIDKIYSNDYAGIIFVGGMGALEYLNNEKVNNLLSDFVESDKIIGAICIAPIILASSGFFTNRKMTITSSESINLVKYQVVFVDQPLVVDKNLVTASGPRFSRLFGKTLVDLIKYEK